MSVSCNGLCYMHVIELVRARACSGTRLHPCRVCQATAGGTKAADAVGRQRVRALTRPTRTACAAATASAIASRQTRPCSRAPYHSRRHPPTHTYLLIYSSFTYRASHCLPGARRAGPPLTVVFLTGMIASTSRRCGSRIQMLSSGPWPARLTLSSLRCGQASQYRDMIEGI